jgi:hypothetical protein
MMAPYEMPFVLEVVGGELEDEPLDADVAEFCAADP